MLTVPHYYRGCGNCKRLGICPKLPGKGAWSSLGWVLRVVGEQRTRSEDGASDAACLCVSATGCPTASGAGAVRMTSSTGASGEPGSR